MKYNWTFKVGELDPTDRAWFEKMNPGYTCTGETLEERYEEEHGWDGGATTYAVMKGKWTRYGMCRDCGDHYIIARWSRYDRIEKGTLQLTRDVEDR